MTTTLPAPAAVIQLPARPSTDPAPVRIVTCHYCTDTFTPTPDPDGGPAWDVDSNGDGEHCCDGCFCSSPTCLVGHHPDQPCPALLALPDEDIVAREEDAVYGDPDRFHDARVEHRFEACVDTE